METANDPTPVAATPLAVNPSAALPLQTASEPPAVTLRTPEPAAPKPAQVPHSGVGIASLILTAIVTVSLFAAFVVAGVLNTQGRGQTDPLTMLVGFVVISLLGLDLVALGLGITALCQRDRKKLFGVLGTVISSVVLLGTAGLILVGVMMAQQQQ